jgi:hypothetical protein
VHFINAAMLSAVQSITPPKNLNFHKVNLATLIALITSGAEVTHFHKCHINLGSIINDQREVDI